MSRLILAVIILIGLSTSVHAQSDAGYEAFKRGDYTTAHRVWKVQAGKGNLSAQYNLGILYHHGLGVRRQLSEAAKWYLRAAEGGMATAQEAIGDFYASGIFFHAIDYANAAKWFRKAAMQGRASAQLRLGVQLANGLGVSLNMDAAIKWLRKAQKQGDSEAQKWLLTLENRTGFETKLAVDAKADLKDGIAAYIRGDYASALRIFEQPAKGEMPKAQFWLDLMEFTGSSETPSTPKISDACTNYFISQSQQYEIDVECKDITSNACVNYLIGQNRGYDIGSVCKDIKSDACIGFLISRDRGYDIGTECKGVTSNSCIRYLDSYYRGYDIGTQCKDVGSAVCVKYLISQDRGYDIQQVCGNISSDVCVEYLIKKNRSYDIETDCINISSDDCVKFIIFRDIWEKIQTFCVIDNDISS